MEKPDLKFLLFTSPAEARSSQHRKIVRSHVTRLQHHRSKTAQAAASRTKSGAKICRSESSIRPQRRHSPVTSSAPQDLILSDRRQHQEGHTCTNGAENTAGDCATCSLNRVTASVVAHSAATGALCYRTLAIQDGDNILGYNLHGLELDLAAVMAFYRAMVLKQSDDLNDQFGRARHSRWEPVIYEHPVLLTMTIVVATRLQVSVSGRELSKKQQTHMLAIEHFQLQRINEALTDAQGATSDHILLTVTLAASYEAKHGLVERSRTHLDGLAQMVAIRGGLTTIGEENPYIARVLTWLLTNLVHIQGHHAAVEEILAMSRLTTIQPNAKIFRGDMGS